MASCRAACPAHDGEIPLAEAAGRLRTEVRFAALTTSSWADGHPPWGSFGGGGLTFLAAVAGASSVGAVATSSGSAAAVGAAVGLSLVIGALTGLGAALRRLAGRNGGARRPALDILATLTALTCLAVSVTAVIASTTPPSP